MSEKFISSAHIEKLGHKLPEIRERALLNIVSKLERGFLYDNELARCKELFLKLLDWFKLSPGNSEDVVLNLLHRILHSEPGIMLIDLFGSLVLKEEFLALKNVISDRNTQIIESIIELLENNAQVVPPLKSNVPLSYRSDEESGIVEATATTMEGFVQNSEAPFISNRCDFSESSFEETSRPENPFHYYVLPWQWLLNSDLHVLVSVEDTLKCGNEPGSILNSCQFLNEVLFEDFSPEVFLQRPSIVKLLHDLLWTCPSSRITTVVLKCLNKLSITLVKRIHFYSDPCTHNLKLNNYLQSFEDETGLLSQRSSEREENLTETMNLMRTQMNIPQFCLNTINGAFDYLHAPPESSGDNFRRKKCLIGVNFALVLLNNCINLLKLSVKRSVWLSQGNNKVETVLKKFTETFNKYGFVLNHFRLLTMSEETNEEARLVYMHLLYNFTLLFHYLIPFDESKVLPLAIKNCIASSLLDPVLFRIYPDLQETILRITKSFTNRSEDKSMETYEKVMEICESISAAVEFFHHFKTLPFHKNVNLAKRSLLCLELHGDISFVRNFIELCSAKLSVNGFDESLITEIEDVILAMLSHVSPDIKLAAFKACRKKVIKTIGAKLNVSKCSLPGSQVVFLLRPRILTEIITFGLCSENKEIFNCADDIIIHILKCKILVCDEIWTRVVAAVTPVLPLLLCYANNKSALGKTILSILDPDRSRSLELDEHEVLRCNMGLLFCNNADVRVEAVSRISWILCMNAESKNLSPNLNNLQDKALSLITRLDHLVDYKNLRASQHFYQSASLLQVLELLKSTGVEPVIRRSAITQIGVMMDDPLMHSSFLDNNGLSVIKNIMLSALTESTYKDYPDSIIPCISVLKNLCLYNSLARQSISTDTELFNYILRGVFMFCMEERIKQDGSVLLLLLVFVEYVRGSPLKCDLSLPQILCDKLTVPIVCQTHWERSENCLPSIADIKEDKWALKSLQIHWNLEWFKGIENLFDADLHYCNKATFADALKLSKNDLLIIKSSSIECIIEKHLEKIYKKSSHAEIVSSINIIWSFYNLIKDEKIKFAKSLEDFDWEKYLGVFLSTPPSSESQDVTTLTHILNFLPHLTSLIKQDQKNFIIENIKSSRHFFIDLFALNGSGSDNECSEREKLIHSALNIIIASVCAEKHKNWRFPESSKSTLKPNYASWRHLIEAIVFNMQFSDAQQFYNMGHLDHLLNALVHLTSSIGWSGSKEAETPKRVLIILTNGLFELLHAFHCGKGPVADNSFMGLSITRNIILILNHLLAEMQQFNLKNWEENFLGTDINGEFTLSAICKLVKSRDVVLRAASLHFLSGVAVSRIISEEMLQEIQCDNMDVCNLALSILCDNEESSVCREHAAVLLANLVSHIFNDNCAKNVDFENGSQRFLKYLDYFCAFEEFESILKRIYKKRDFHFREFVPTQTDDCEDDFLFLLRKTSVSLKNGWDSLNGDVEKTKFQDVYSLSTFGLVKSIAQLLHNLATPRKEQILASAQDVGLIKLFLRCITLPSNEVLETTRDLIFYSDILEMNTAICVFLSLAATKNANCLITISNTKDCVEKIVSILNPDLFIVGLPELVYLKNKMWSSIFNLLDVLLAGNGSDCDRSLDATGLVQSLSERNYQEPFISSVCEAINTDSSNELQLSALSSLTSLLKCDADANKRNEDVSHSATSLNSVRTLLDTTRTPRTSKVFTSDKLMKKSEPFATLEVIYFSANSKEPKKRSPTQNTAGAELCKILLNLYEVLYLDKENDSQTKVLAKKTVVLNTLTNLLLASSEAKTYALNQGLLHILIQQLQEMYVKLSLESVDSLRSVSNKKRILPVLDELKAILGLLTNFIFQNEDVKRASALLCLADVCHKLWVWFLVQKSLLTVALKLICTLTNDCLTACQTLPLTSAIAGSGMKKSANNASLLHAICSLITSEMNQISKTHNLEIISLCFQILQHSIAITECRSILIKVNFLQSVSKLHPAFTKRQKPWDYIENLWLDFLNEFTTYSEGQVTIGKCPEILEIVFNLCSSSRVESRISSLEILRNVAFHSSNKTRLLNSGDFLNILALKLSPSSDLREVSTVSTTMWALASNCQKAKLVFKCAQLDIKLQDCLRVLQLSNSSIDQDELEQMQYTLNLFKKR